MLLIQDFLFLGLTIILNIFIAICGRLSVDVFAKWRMVDHELGIFDFCRTRQLMLILVVFKCVYGTAIVARMPYSLQLTCRKMLF